MSQGFDAEPLENVVRSPTEPAIDARDSGEEKVACRCPGCERPLRIRRKYFGTKVACKLCGHRFLARPSASPDGDGGGGGARGADPELARLAASLGRWKGRVKAGQAVSAQLSQNLAAAMATLVEQSADLAAIQELVAALHEDLGRVQHREPPDPDVVRQAIAEEVGRRLVDDRAAAAVRWVSLQRELDALRQRTEEQEQGRSEASRAAAARFEQISAQVSAQVERLAAQVRAAEEGGGEWVAIREHWAVLTDQTRAIVIRGEDQAAALGTSLGVVRAEQEGLTRSLAAQADRQDRVEATLAEFEAAAVAQREAHAARWSDFEAQAAPRWLEVEALRQRLDQLVADQTGQRTAWDASAERIAAIESHAATAWRGVEAHRAEQALASEGLRAEVQRLREEVASLRSELAGLRSARVDIPPAQPEIRADVERPRPPLSPEGSSAPISIPATASFDSLIWDLARERIGGGDHPPSTPGQPVIIPPAAERPLLDAAGYQESARRFDQAMLAGRFADAEREARLLAQTAAARIGEFSLDHALWLRNLALSLLRAGRPDESGAALRRALVICESTTDRTPRIVCLLDLADYHGELRDLASARQAGERALALLDAEPNPAGPLRTRAENLMARIGRLDSRPLATNSIMISV